MARLESQMEDMMGYPTGGDPSIIDPTTGKPYDDSSRMRQQAEITRQADVMEAFQSDENRVKLPKLLEEKITPLFNKPEIKFSAQDLEKQYEDYNPEFGKSNELDEYGMKRYVADRSSFLTEPKLNTYNTSLIDTIIDAGFLLRNEAQGVTNEKSLLSNFNKIKDKDAVIGFLKEALGPGPYGEGFDINKASWCAAFVNHILGIAGFDQLKYGENKSEESYNKIRANAYLKYGTPVNSLEDAKEGDIIIWDLKPNNSDDGTHVTFYAGDRYGKQGVGDSVDIVGGNHGIGEVSLKGAGSKDVYVKKNIRGIVRVTKNNITQDFVNELADIDPIFKPFTELNKKGNPVPLVSLRPQLRPKKFNEGGSVTNIEREMEEALGLPPRAKETKPTVQEYMDDTGAMGLLTGPMSRGSGLLGGATAAYQFGRDLLGFNEQADDRALAGRKDDEGITPTKNYIYDLAIDKLGATPYQAQTVAMLAEATPIAGEYLGIEETANLIKEGRYKDAALSGAGTVAGIIPFIGDAAKAALRRGVDPEVVNQIIAGKGAKDFYGDDLRKAVELEERGFSPEEIEEITGRFTVGSAEDDYFSEPLMVRGEPKPYFKFEIDDSDVLIKSNDGNITLKETSPSQTANVGDIIDHPKLFEQYPEARNIQFYFDDAKESGAHFNPSKGSRGSIVISGSRKDIDVNDQDFRNSFFHELQHAIQWQDKKIKGLEQIAGSPMGYMKTVAKPEKAYKGDLYLKKLGQNTKLINIKDEILELYKEGQKTYSWDSKSPYKTIFVNPEAAKKIAKLMRSLEQESFRTYMQTASEIEARVSGYRSFPQTEFQKKYNKPKNPIVPEIKKQTRIETSEEAYQNMPNEPIQQAKNRAIYKLKPMTDEEIIRYANGAVNFARYAEGIEPELKGFSAWGPTQKGYAQGGLTSMNDQTQMAFALGGEAETVDPVSGNDVPPGSLPEEVRDDIDAKLSEGEYVVPADVVRFFGVKFFEDLRTEAKMGLQQMDADGRIGGEPVPAPEQEDSMDVAELKAELSSSGMYAGGLTDGGSLDTFIDDASRDPMVNGRMRASGATVKMAVGGLAVGNYGDVTKVDGIIQKLMTAANKDPALMEKLASKGIMVNKTGADKKSAEMQQANKPQEPIEAAEGVSVQPRAFKLGGTTEVDTSQQDSPFNISSFNTLGQNLFEAAGIKDPVKVVTDTFLNKEGKIEQIVLIAPDGSEIPVAWNTTMPLPPGFTRKATNDYGVKPAASVETSSAVVAAPVSKERVKTGDDSAVGAMPTPTASSGTGFNAGNTKDYSNSTIKELQEHLKTTKRYTKAGYVAAIALGPVGTLIGLATKANQAIVERRIENELKRRADKAKTKNLRQINNLDNKALSEEELITLGALQKNLRIANNLSDTGEIIATGKDGEPVGFNPVRSILNAIFEPAADRIDARVKAKRDAAGGIQTSVDPLTAPAETAPAKSVQETFLTSKSAVEKGKGIRFAAAEAKRIADETRKRQDAERLSRLGYDQSGKSDGGESYLNSVANKPGYTRRGNTVYAPGGGAVAGLTESGGTWGTGAEYAKNQQDKIQAAEDRYEQQREDFFSNLFDEGGLVAKPVAAKQKKRKTQRRKGLGTRP